MKRIATTLLFLIFPLITSAVEVGLGVKGGTTGLGVDLTFPLTEGLNARAGFYYASLGINYDGDAENENVEVDFQLQGIPLLLDWHPNNGGFRISGGIVINDNLIEGTATSEEVELNGIDFLLSSFEADATFADVAPYVGIGWGNAISDDGRWSLSFDLGVIYQGSVDISASAVSANAAIQDAVNVALEAEIQDIEDDAEDYKFYPVLTIGLSYRF